MNIISYSIIIFSKYITLYNNNNNNNKNNNNNYNNNNYINTNNDNNNIFTYRINKLSTNKYTVHK